VGEEQVEGEGEVVVERVRDPVPQEEGVCEGETERVREVVRVRLGEFEREGDTEPVEVGEEVEDCVLEGVGEEVGQVVEVVEVVRVGE